MYKRQILRRAKKPVLLVANKTDNHELQYNAPEFYSLGLGDPYCISAVTGSGCLLYTSGKVKSTSNRRVK